eukprot:jgi/Hompol1/3090/HPOL_003120-RA
MQAQIVSLGSATWTADNGKGEVHLDLIRAGVLERDPYFRFDYSDRDLTRWVALDSWSLSRTFLPDDSLLAASKILLVFEGIDTVARVMLNDVCVLETDNQFVRYTADITKLLKQGPNTIAVRIESAVSYAERESKLYPYVVPDGFAPEQHGERNRNF